MRRATLVASILSALAAAGQAVAEDTPALLTGYNLTSWTQKDGIESALIWSIAQDSVGYLWLGTDDGALRFDGVRFVRWDSLARVPRPSGSVRSVSVARNGAVWFGLGEPGGIVVLENGTAKSFGVAEGLAEGVVMAIAQGSDGVMWAGGRFGLQRLVGGRWQRVDGLPAGLVSALLFDNDAVIVGSGNGVFRRSTPERAFERLGDFDDNARSVSRDPTGRLWVTHPIVGFRSLLDDSQGIASSLRVRGSRVMHDSRGNLWVGSGGQGLWRVRRDSAGKVAIERTSTATGLSDDGVTEIVEDREGNVWVATRDGLNRLTPHKLTPITDVGIATAVDATPDGTVWVGSVDAVVSFANGRVNARSPPISVTSPPMTGMHVDERGRVWVATARSLARIEGRTLLPVPLSGETVAELTHITSDSAGGLWLHDAVRGLLRWRAGTVTAAPLPTEIQSAELLATFTDRDGRAWFSFDQGHVATIDSTETLRVFGESDGLSVGPYRAIHQDSTGAVWLGGDEGLTRFADGKFLTLAATRDAPIRLVTGIADDQLGALWIAVEGAGLLRLSRDEVARALADRSYAAHYTAYDKVDGSAGISRWFGHKAAARSADGRLWFVAGRGVTVVDPNVLDAEGSSQDVVQIEGVVVDGHTQSAASTPTLPPRTARVQIDYTVLDLTTPQKRRFRYRLEGFDSEWIDAGTRHSAFYTSLPPRTYTFRVMASSADGSFDAAPTSEWQFSIRPAFYQTWWFGAVSVVAIGLVVAAAWRMHVLRMRRQFSLLVGERARLSREVHDTLLQSMFGYALQFDALAADASTSAPQLSERLAELRRQVEGDIREARQSIWNLRSPRLEQHDLPSALKEMAEQAVRSTRTTLTFEVRGAARRVAPLVEEQLLRIGGEAVANAVRHGDPSRLDIALAYGSHDITLRVADDGRGFDADVNRDFGGHFGLTTMRERAESVGGSLRIESAPGLGTTITASVPAA